MDTIKPLFNTTIPEIVWAAFYTQGRQVYSEFINSIVEISQPRRALPVAAFQDAAHDYYVVP